MDRERHQRNYDLHSWSGIALGFFVYVIAFTGCIALFHHEILAWEDPAKRLTVAEEPAMMNDTFNAWIDEKTEGVEVDFVRFSYPNAYEPYFSAFLTIDIPIPDGPPGAHEHRSFEQRWDSHTGAPLPERGEGLSRWVLDFHRDLMWPEGLGGRTAGRTIVGIAGVILMLSIVTGVVAHTKIFQELFTLRYLRSMRLKWQDTHKVLGLWGLPFYTMIALTGAVLGVVAILAPIVALLTFKGDQEALINAVLGAPVEAAGVPAQMLSVDDLADLRMPDGDKSVAFIIMNNWRDENARFDIYFDADTELAQVDGFQIDGVTGEKIMDSGFETLTLGNRFVNALTPLHYGTYGGIALKFLYLILGLMLAVITALGLMMWVERRLHGAVGSRSPQFYQRLSHFIVGAMAGLPLASAAIFHLDKLYIGEEGARLYWTGISYFAVWALGIGYAFFRRDDYASARHLLLVIGGLFATLPLINMLATGEVFLSVFSSAHKVTGYVDMTLFVIGALTIFAALKLPKQRTEVSESRVKEAGLSSDQPVVAPGE